MNCAKHIFVCDKPRICMDLQTFGMVISQYHLQLSYKNNLLICSKRFVDKHRGHVSADGSLGKDKSVVAYGQLYAFVFETFKDKARLSHGAGLGSFGIHTGLVF